MAHWITFSDGTAGCVEIESQKKDPKQPYPEYLRELEARVIAKAKELRPNLEVVKSQSLPYPASPRLNNLSNCPNFCMHPLRCAGRTSCPRSYSCVE